MLTDTLNSAGGLLTALATLITALGGALLVVKNISNNKTDSSDEIVQGQAITSQDLWLQDLREDAAEADILRHLLTQALARLSGAGLPYEDLLPPGIKRSKGENSEL